MFVLPYRSQKEWQIRVKKLWKPLPHDIGEKLEQLYDPSSQKSKGRKMLPDTDYEVCYSTCSSIYIEPQIYELTEEKPWMGVIRACV